MAGKVGLYYFFIAAPIIQFPFQWYLNEPGNLGKSGKKYRNISSSSSRSYIEEDFVNGVVGVCLFTELF